MDIGHGGRKPKFKNSPKYMVSSKMKNVATVLPCILGKKREKILFYGLFEHRKGIVVVTVMGFNSFFSNACFHFFFIYWVIIEDGEVSKLSKSSLRSGKCQCLYKYSLLNKI